MSYKCSEHQTATTFFESPDIEIAINHAIRKPEIKGERGITFNHLKKNPTAGYGRCKACDCKGYISKHNGSHECKTCGHHYDRHYSA